jgi:hypothetical protein
MYTLCIRYTLDPNRVKHFKDYVEHELEAIRNAGGKIVGYFLPTDYAGPTNVAYGLIDFLTLASYEQYRKALAGDPLHQRNAEALTRSGVIINMERSIIERCSDSKAIAPRFANLKGQSLALFPRLDAETLLLRAIAARIVVGPISLSPKANRNPLPAGLGGAQPIFTRRKIAKREFWPW